MNSTNVCVVEKACDEDGIEIEILSSLQHPNIVPLLGSLAYPDRYCLVMPELRYKPENTPGGKLSVALRYLHDVLLALQYLHGQSILHGDVKPHNIMCAAVPRYFLFLPQPDSMIKIYQHPRLALVGEHDVVTLRQR